MTSTADVLRRAVTLGDKHGWCQGGTGRLAGVTSGILNELQADAMRRET
jgi:hypothetical protein